MANIAALIHEINSLKRLVCCFATETCATVYECIADLADGDGDYVITITGSDVTLSPSSGGGAPVYDNTLIPFGDGSTPGGITSASFYYNPTEVFNVAFATGNGSFMHLDDSLEEFLVGTSTSSEFNTTQFIIQDFTRTYNSFSINTGINPQVNLGDFGNQGNSTWVQIDDFTGTVKNVFNGSVGNYIVRNSDTSTDAVTVLGTNGLQLNEYGSGTFTGTPAYDLSVDSGGNVIETTAPYKTYAATLLTGSGGSIDTTVLENNLSGAIVWTYGGSAGTYVGTLAGAFPDTTKVLALVSCDSQNLSSTNNSALLGVIDSNTLNLATLQTGVLLNAEALFYIEIRVYN